jgi:hypothetical protein
MAAGTAPKTAIPEGSAKPPADGTRSAAGRPGPPLHPAQRAAAQVIDKHTIRVTLPDNIGTIRLPEPKRLAFYGGIATLAAFGIVDWPVAIVLGIGHLLAEDQHHKVLCDFGEALAEA